jgi:hypothetical protein
LCDPIVDPEPLAPVLRETSVQQVAEVTRGPGLRDLQESLDLADAQLPMTKHEGEDAEPGILAERFELGSQMGHGHICV